MSRESWGTTMRKSFALAGSALFFVAAPGTVAGFLPWYIGGWQVREDWPGSRIGGWLLIGLALIPLLESFLRFALKGLGTPAPVAPTRHLVVSGFYRFVRNPMYVGVVAAIFGQAWLFGDIRLVAYAIIAWLTMHLFVVFYEEPKLQKTFGEEYDRFRANVPRWIPRLTPWQG